LERGIMTILDIVVVGSIASRKCWEPRDFKEAVSIRHLINCESKAESISLSVELKLKEQFAYQTETS
jgi:hypothetical protein